MTESDKKIKVSFEKSELVTEEVTFLGKGISVLRPIKWPDRAKCQATKEKPTTLKGLQGWLGAANYFRKYKPDYGQVTQPLYNLVDQKNIPKSKRKKNGAPDWKKVAVIWTEFGNWELWKIIKNLIQWTSLVLPDFARDMSVTTYASELGYGGQL